MTTPHNKWILRILLFGLALVALFAIGYAIGRFAALTF